MGDATSKLCRKCGETKPLGEFYRRNGLIHSPCKTCALAWKRVYDDAKREPLHPGGQPCMFCQEPCPPNGRGRAPRKFCSKLCASRAWAKENYDQKLRVPLPPAGHPCAWCNEPTPEKKIGGQPRKYCSRACAKIGTQAALKERGYHRDRTLEQYGLTLQTYEAMRVAQGNTCAICGTSDAGTRSGEWHVDHCHELGHVRGLLCGACNRGLGLFRDDPAVLLAAVDYLARSVSIEAARS